MAQKKLAWGILSTGGIAHAFAEGLAASKTGYLAAVASRDEAKAKTFAAKFSTPENTVKSFGSYEALLASPDVEAVYIATPHPYHAHWAVATARAGKHILCEKPLTMNHAEAMVVFEAALKHDVFAMEAFMYRCHPQTEKVIELVRSGIIGPVKLIRCIFSFRSWAKLDGRLVNAELGGGGILDVGCYTISMARLIAGAAQGKRFVDPLKFEGMGVLGQETGTDDYAVGILKFPNGILAQVTCGVQLNQENTVRIYGMDGDIIVSDPWTPSKKGGTTQIELRLNGKSEFIKVESPTPLYTIEADAVAAHIAARQAPQMSWDDTLGNMKVLDQWRDVIGLSHPAEKAESFPATISGDALSVAPDSVMKYGKIPGVPFPVSRLVMGVDNQFRLPHTVALFDDFFSRGGNCFDTAFVYGQGKCEQQLGHWLKLRGIRDKVAVISKGAHSPDCNPYSLKGQFKISLDRLQTDYADVYMMHRDNPDVPVGEFVDVLNELKRQGRIRAFGGSNWSKERIEEANAYAASKGLEGFTVLSNNFSLARMMHPIWPGCIAASEPEFREWLERTQLCLFSWSSQARGFFTNRANPADKSDPELVRTWYSDDNFKRRERAIELAKKKGVQPINIALAYVLAQSFPAFCLIGPRVLSETRTSWPALGVTLTPAECAWLDLR